MESTRKSEFSIDSILARKGNNTSPVNSIGEQECSSIVNNANGENNGNNLSLENRPLFWNAAYPFLLPHNPQAVAAVAAAEFIGMIFSPFFGKKGVFLGRKELKKMQNEVKIVEKLCFMAIMGMNFA